MQNIKELRKIILPKHLFHQFFHLFKNKKIELFQENFFFLNRWGIIKKKNFEIFF